MTTKISREAPSQEDVQIFPTSFAQQHIWTLEQLEANKAINNSFIAVHLKLPMILDALERSLNVVVLRHGVLRTTFQMIEEQLVQVIAPTLTIPLSVVDLRNFSEVERKNAIHRLTTEEALKPFDLTYGPLVRTNLLQLSTEEYILLVTMHHIICDVLSLNVFLQELATVYEAVLVGQSSPLPELPIQYTDFALWQHEALQESIFTEHLDYWKLQLADSPAGLDLPTDRPRLPVPTSQISIYCITLPKALTDALKELSCQEEVTLYMTLVAAFQTFLYRYTGQDDLVIGTVTAGRMQAETKALIGVFENTLVLRTDLSGDPTFRQMLDRVRGVMLKTQEHEDLPFEYLVKELRPKRQWGQNPLFQVLLVLEPPLPTLPSGWTLAQMEIERGISKFDLALELCDQPEGLISRFEYSTDLFDQKTIARMARQWQTLLEGLVVNPTWHLTELPLLTEEERHQLLVEWNATRVAYPKDKCVHQLFEAQVQRTPDAIAVIFESEQLTYWELNRRANQLAYHLRHLGVGPSVLVGICVERSLGMVVGLLGILKAGGAYVPLDPGFPPERIAFMLEDAKASVLVTKRYLTSQLPQHGAKVVCLDSDNTVLGQQSETNLFSTATPGNLAYVIYTSGSTGHPKGVQIIHRAVINFLQSMREKPGLKAEDILLAVTTLSFDIAGLELFLPLVVGARVIVAGSDVVADGTALMETLVRTHTTVMQATPITWRILLAAGWQGKHDLKILCGGEALPLDLAQQLLSKAASLWNLYGPTETTIWSSVCEIKQGEKSITIGRPIANTQIYLLDRHLQPVPIGVPGELFIGGDGLAQGYLNRPELTSERFIPHPFSGEPGAFLYKAGDLARYRSNGTIEHLGRLDFQVKMRGFRIELGEIEEVLSQHPAVHQSVVIAREDTPDDRRLVAYLVLRKDQATMIDDLKSHVMKRMPVYMVPSAFVLLETLPLTPNGKIDRRALPAPESSRSTAMDTFVAPTLPLHHQLVQIWEDLLGVRPIGIKDDFFDLGGHSLLAIRLFNRIEQVLGKKLSPSAFFADATIEFLTSALMEGAKIDDSLTPIVAVQTSGIRRPFFFLHGQWTGGAFYCTEMARYLGHDQPFYLLEPYKFDNLSVLPSFEGMAAAHIEALRRIQAEGPYLLGGWCNGALIAYEMARQLHAQGQMVDLLVLMDSEPPISRWNRAHRIIAAIGRLLRLSQGMQVDWFLSYRYLRLSFHFWRLKKARNAGTAKRVEFEVESEFGPSDEVLRRDWLGIYDWIASGYMPHPYPGKVALFWTDEEPLRIREWDKSMFTQLKANDVETYIVPGNHITSRTRYISVLADKLSLCMKKFQNTLPGK